MGLPHHKAHLQGCRTCHNIMTYCHVCGVSWKNPPVTWFQIKHSIGSRDPPRFNCQSPCLSVRGGGGRHAVYQASSPLHNNYYPFVGHVELNHKMDKTLGLNDFPGVSRSINTRQSAPLIMSPGRNTHCCTGDGHSSSSTTTLNDHPWPLSRPCPWTFR